MESDRSESAVQLEGRIALSVMTKVNDQSDPIVSLPNRKTLKCGQSKDIQTEQPRKVRTKPNPFNQTRDNVIKRIFTQKFQ
jgi:hypothetical protein